MKKQELLTSSQVAQELGITTQWANHLARTGKIEAQQVGKNWIVSRSALEDYKRQQEKSGKTA